MTGGSAEDWYLVAGAARTQAALVTRRSATRRGSYQAAFAMLARLNTRPDGDPLPWIEAAGQLLELAPHPVVDRMLLGSSAQRGVADGLVEHQTWAGLAFSGAVSMQAHHRDPAAPLIHYADALEQHADESPTQLAAQLRRAVDLAQRQRSARLQPGESLGHRATAQLQAEQAARASDCELADVRLRAGALPVPQALESLAQLSAHRCSEDLDLDEKAGLDRRLDDLVTRLSARSGTVAEPLKTRLAELHAVRWEWVPPDELCASVARRLHPVEPSRSTGHLAPARRQRQQQAGTATRSEPRQPR